jgi:hypothetical protein
MVYIKYKYGIHTMQVWYTTHARVSSSTCTRGVFSSWRPPAPAAGIAGVVGGLAALKIREHYGQIIGTRATKGAALIRLLRRFALSETKQGCLDPGKAGAMVLDCPTVEARTPRARGLKAFSGTARGIRHARAHRHVMRSANLVMLGGGGLAPRSEMRVSDDVKAR